MKLDTPVITLTGRQLRNWLIAIYVVLLVLALVLAGLCWNLTEQLAHIESDLHEIAKTLLNITN